jgi:hypothetical protein
MVLHFPGAERVTTTLKRINALLTTAMVLLLLSAPALTKDRVANVL